jgi:ribosomal protein S18 acetylase RimI-like enzyme
MHIDRARQQDCRAIAELAMMAGEGIPAYFWEQSRQAGEDLFDVGARNARSQVENFSYRNSWLARFENQVAGLLLAYPLPDAEQAEDPADYPEFIRPLIELENQAPGSFYINMLASYPQFRNRGIGAALMLEAERQAGQVACDVVSLEVFDQNEAALRLYQRLGYRIVDRRSVIPHPCFRYNGQVLLLTKTIDVQETH